MSRRGWDSVLVLGATGLLLLLAWRAMAQLTFFSSDVGLRFLQVRELAANGWQSFAISYPGRGVDPELRHVPWYYAFSLIDGQIFLNISPFLPLVASWLYALLSVPGLALVPVLGSVFSALAVLSMARSAQLPGARWTFVIALAATPLLFYSAVLWDHSLGAALGAWAAAGIALWLAQRRHGQPGNLKPLLLAGVAAGLSLGQRPEMYVFSAALGVGFVIAGWPVRWRPVVALAVGGLLGAALVWSLNAWWSGHPLGMGVAPHFSGYGAPPTFRVASAAVAPLTRITRFLAHAEPRADGVARAAALLAAGCALVLAATVTRRWRGPLLLAGMALATAGYILFVPIALNNTLIGLVATLPLIVLSLAALALSVETAEPQRSVQRFAALTTALFLAAMFIFWPGYGGLQFGARYLLPAVPLLVFLAFGGYQVARRTLAGRQRSAFTLLAAALLALSLVLQGLGVRRIFVDHEPHTAIRAGLEALPGPIILTNHVFMPSFMTSIGNKSFVYVRDEADLAALLERLADAGVSQTGVVARAAGQLRAPAIVDSRPVTQTDLERFGPRDVYRSIITVQESTHEPVP